MHDEPRWERSDGSACIGTVFLTPYARAPPDALPNRGFALRWTGILGLTILNLGDLESRALRSPGHVVQCLPPLDSGTGGVLLRQLGRQTRARK